MATDIPYRPRGLAGFVEALLRRVDRVGMQQTQVVQLLGVDGDSHVPERRQAR